MLHGESFPFLAHSKALAISGRTAVVQAKQGLAYFLNHQNSASLHGQHQLLSKACQYWKKNLYVWIRSQFTAASWLSWVVSSASFNLVAKESSRDEADRSPFTPCNTPAGIEAELFFVILLISVTPCLAWHYLLASEEPKQTMHSWTATNTHLHNLHFSWRFPGMTVTLFFSVTIQKSSEISARPPELISNKMDPAFRSKAPLLYLWVALGF